MKNIERYDNYIEIVKDRKNVNMLSSLFFAILSVLVISYSLMNNSTINIISTIVITGSLIISIIKTLSNQKKLSVLTNNKNKYINA